jgi:hypothetical protein
MAWRFMLPYSVRCALTQNRASRARSLRAPAPTSRDEVTTIMELEKRQEPPPDGSETEAAPGSDGNQDEVDEQSEESFPASDPPSY